VRGDLKPGRYKITLTATDPQDENLTAESTVRVRVTKPANPGPATNPAAANSGGLSGAVNQ